MKILIHLKKEEKYISALDIASRVKLEEDGAQEVTGDGGSTVPRHKNITPTIGMEDTSTSTRIQNKIKEPHQNNNKMDLGGSGSVLHLIVNSA